MDEDSFNGNTCEIVEIREEIISEFKTDQNPGNSYSYKSGKRYSVEDNINSLFQGIDFKNSAKGINTARSQKSALKRPMRVTSSGIGLSEPLSLKQAFRGLCISQASEMAALKHLSKPSCSSRVSESVTIKRLVSQGELVESRPSNELCSILNHQISTASVHHSTVFVDATTSKTMTTRPAYRNQIVPLASEVQSEKLVMGYEEQVLANSSSVGYESDEAPEVSLKVLPASSSKDSLSSSMPDKGMEEKIISPPSSSTGNEVDKPTSSNTSLAKPIFKDKNFLKEKAKQNLCSSSSYFLPSTRKDDNDLASCASNLNKLTGNSDLKNEMRENKKLSPSSHSKHSIEVLSVNVGKDSSKPAFSLTSSKRTKFPVTKYDEKSRSKLKEKGKFSQSSKVNIGEHCCSTSASEESNLSSSIRCGHRPHMSKHLRWEAVGAIQKHGNLSLRHFKLLRKLGSGDIATVYLAELIGTSCLFALKVMKNELLVSKKKMFRVQTESEILQMLDHPFLPTLYAHIATDKFSCLVMEYCPGGDLHVLRQRQPFRRFSEQATRFYVAEVLLALEYLHMLGVVYRDLKPENILVREDGHIMLTDFDLSLRCSVNPMIVKSSSTYMDPTKKMPLSSRISDASCIHPFCLKPNWKVSCFAPILLSSGSKSQKSKTKDDIAAQIDPLPQLVVEPTSARSNSFVGTYEYLAPEIIRGEGHGSAVDWWTFGILLFELLYGKTPFKGPSNEDTLANVVSQSLKFPDTPRVSFQARDLITGLLIKDPESRLGYVKGAAEIKQHSFFEGLNWALIRSATPPKLPKFRDWGTVAKSVASHNENASEDCADFDLF